MHVRSLIEHIERIAPLSHQADWDKSGIQIAARRERLSKIAVTIDPTPEAVARALDWGAHFILTHHPLSLAPRLPAAIDNYHDVLRLVLGADAWLYAAHTSLDVQPLGPAGWFADALDLRNRRTVAPLDKKAPYPAPGYALIGELPAPLAPQPFLDLLATLLPRTTFAISVVQPDGIERVAYSTGSGGSFIEAVFAAQAHVYVTGDVKYHQALDGGRFGMIVDCGHFILEERMMSEMADQLRGELAERGIEIQFFPGRDPFRTICPGKPAEPGL